MPNLIPLTTLSETYYPTIVALTDDCIDSRFVFLIKRMLGSMAAIAGQEGSIEIYAVDYQPVTLLPTLNLISSSGLDDAKLEQLFDELTPLLNLAANNQSLGATA